MVSIVNTDSRAYPLASGRHSLQLDQVYCIDETGGNWFSERGEDDIYLGGVSIGSGGVTKIPYFKVGGFDDRDKKTYRPSRRFAYFSQGGHTAVVLVLVEKDSGDQMNEFLDEQVKQYQATFFRYKNAASDSAGSEGEDSDSLATQIAIEVIKEVGKYLKNKIVSARKDDIFEPKLVRYSRSTAKQTVRFTGHDATYDISYHWQNG